MNRADHHRPRLADKLIELALGRDGVVDINQWNVINAKWPLSILQPPTVYKDFLLVGWAGKDWAETEAPPGTVFALDVRTGRENWSVERWNYRWTGQYGSKDYSVADPTRTGKDLMVLDAVKLSADRRTVSLTLPEMAPAHQMKITYRIKSADGKSANNEIYQTIHKIPEGVAQN